MAEDFDPDAYLAKKAAQDSEPFDPDAYLAEKAVASSEVPEVGAGETYLNRATDAIPLGRQASNILTTAGLQAAKLFGLGSPSATLTPQAKADLRAMGEDVPEDQNAIPGVLDSYRDIRDTRDIRTAAGSEQNPWAGRLGTATGIAASLLAPLPKFAPKGAGIAPRLAAAGKTGAAYGAGLSLAGGRADLTRGEIGQALKDVSGVQGVQDAAESAKEGNYLRAALDVAGAGAPGGLVTGLGLGGLMEGARPVASKLKEFAVSHGRKAIQGSSDIAAATRKPLSDAAVQEALDSGLISPGSTTKGIYEKLNTAAESQGATLGRILDRLEEMGVKGPEARALADKFLERYKQSYYSSGANKAVPETYFSEGANLEEVAQGAKNLGLRQAERIKSDLQRQARYDRINANPTEEAKQEIASMLRQANEEAVAQAGAAAPAGSETRSVAQSFVPAKERAAKLYEALAVAEKGASKAMQRSGTSLKDAVLGAATGDPLSAYMAAMGGGFLRGRAASTASSLSNQLANRLGSPSGAQSLAARTESMLDRAGGIALPIERMGPYAAPLAAAAAKGEAALMAAHYVLSKRDPEYLRRLELAQAGGP